MTSLPIIPATEKDLFKVVAIVRQIVAKEPGFAKAWVVFTFSGGTPTISASLNVTSLTDNGTGDTTINFTVPFANANYTFSGASMKTTSVAGVLYGPFGAAPTTTAFRVASIDQSSGLLNDNTYNYAVFFGAQ